MQIHVMNIIAGGDSTGWIFPFRSATAEITEEVGRIAAEAHCADEEVYGDRIRRLVDMEIEQIHQATRN
jgi:hypothetical protein